MNGHIQIALEASEPLLSLLQGVDKQKGRNAGSVSADSQSSHAKRTYQDLLIWSRCGFS